MKKEVFLPPGVQMRLSARIGHIPRQISCRAAIKIENMWLIRNVAPENEIETLDSKMEKIVVDAVLADNGRKVRIIFENHNLHGTGQKRCKIFVLPIRSRQDYWANVTDVRCPACVVGTIRWHEAGYVPGYRICDRCGRTFFAGGAINAGARPKLILDTR